MLSRTAGWHVRPRGVRVALLLLGLAACGTDQPPAPPASDSPAGAIPVSGTERLAWDQEGDVAQLRFQAYVDGLPVKLDAASCNATAPGPQGFPCESPLPPLTSGLHKIALTAVSRVTGLESAQSASIMLNKLPSAAAGSVTASQAASLPEKSGARQAVRAVDEILNTGNGLRYGVRIVATGLEAPADLAVAPDGRLLIAETAGRLLVLRPAADDGTTQGVIIDAGITLPVAPGTTPSVVLHPRFQSNHLVFAGYLAVASDGTTRLRVVRMREIGDSLHEPAVIHEEGVSASPGGGVRIRFGPDGHLYLVSSRPTESATSSGPPAAAGVVLRVGTDDGRSSDGTRLFAAGGDRPHAIAWLQGSGRPWAVLADADGRATLREVAAGADFGGTRLTTAQPLIDVGRATTPGGLLSLQGAAGQPSTLLVALPDNEAVMLVGVGDTTWTETLFSEVLGRVGAVAQEPGGAIYLATRNRDGLGAVAAGDDIIVRLSPRGRSR